jgi:acetate kinase
VIEFNGDSPKELAEGKIEKIGEDKALISHQNLTNNKSIKNEESTEIKDHHAGITS